MKKLLFFALSAFLAFTITSCDKEAAPEPDFNYEIKGNTVVFTNSTKGDVKDFNWSFGDGATSQDENPTHEYAKGGDYLVTLIASNDKGAKEKTKTVTIEGGGDNAVTLPTVPGADGLCVAVNNTTFTTQAGFSVAIELGLAVAVFYDAAGTKYVDAGTVTVDSKELDKSESFYYSYTSTSGEKFSNPISWSSTGSSDYEAFTQDVSLDFPQMSEITSGDINTTQDYEITLKSAITNADSIIVVISGGSNAFQTTLPYTGETVISISSADIKDIGAAETGIISLTAYDYVLETVGDKKIAFVNQGNVTKTVKVQ